MEFEVVNALDPSALGAWRDAWEQLPPERRDVYFHPGFLLANQADGRGSARCLIARSADALLVYPFLLNPVPNLEAVGLSAPAFDVQGPYGYGGPVVNRSGEDPAFLAGVWKEFDAWCRAEQVVAEFCRFHPLIKNTAWANPGMPIVFNRETIYFDAVTYPETFRSQSLLRNHRQMVSKAAREGCTAEIVDAAAHITWFASQYQFTQDLLRARDETRFGPAYFQSLAGQLEGLTHIHWVRRDGNIVAGMIMLESEPFTHAHLMFYNDQRPSSGATNLLIHAAALETGRRGRHILHIGGGRTKYPEDTLLQFKSRLSPHRARFDIGMLPHQPERFKHMQEAWKTNVGPLPEGFFLFYRSDPPPVSNR